MPTVGSPDDWGPDVASVAYEAPDALLLVDPLVPADRADVQAELDALVRRHGQPVTIVTTLQFHRRSREALVERYGASTSRAKKHLPRDVETVVIQGAGETMVWLPKVRALIPATASSATTSGAACVSVPTPGSATSPAGCARGSCARPCGRSSTSPSSWCSSPTASRCSKAAGRQLPER